MRCNMLLIFARKKYSILKSLLNKFEAFKTTFFVIVLSLEVAKYVFLFGFV